jgi:pantetheine-phosphate adenylyltransferase
MSRAIYAGSFDPVTLGHTDLIHRASPLFESLMVAVGNNPAKRYTFDLEKRCELVRESTADLPNVEVAPFTGLLVHTAAKLDATVILRGLRALSDFDLEFRNGLANRDLSGIETMFLLSDPELIYVSSSLVKEIASNGGDPGRYVPPNVAAALAAKFG